MPVPPSALDALRTARPVPGAISTGRSLAGYVAYTITGPDGEPDLRVEVRAELVENNTVFKELLGELRDTISRPDLRLVR